MGTEFSQSDKVRLDLKRNDTCGMFQLVLFENTQRRALLPIDCTAIKFRLPFSNCHLSSSSLDTC